ncbi:MAG: hypothetical protein ABFC73_10070 [Clostridiaceae bacterium]
MSILRKTVAFAAACVLACLPLAGARAEASLPFQTYERGHVSYRANAEEETTVSVVLQDGDIFLLDGNGAVIGTLKVENRIVTFFEGSSNEGVRADVAPALSDESRGNWLRRAVDTGGATVQMLLVTVSGSKDNETYQIQGWIDASKVLNLQYVAQAVSNAPLLSRIAKMNAESAAATKPAASPDSITASPNGAEKNPGLEFVKSPLFILSALGLVITLSILNMVLLIRKSKKKSGKSVAEVEKPKSAPMVCTQAPVLESIEKKFSMLFEKINALSGICEYLKAEVHEVKEKMPQPEKEDWEELAEIANSALQISNYEDWRQAFIQKGWFPQAVLSSELFAPGEYELTEFGMSQNLAAFVSRNPKYKSWIYVIPSCVDRGLRSGRLDDLYQFSSDPSVTAGQYRLVEPATLHSTNGRFFKKLTSGKIFIPVRK